MTALAAFLLGWFLVSPALALLPGMLLGWPFRPSILALVAWASVGVCVALIIWVVDTFGELEEGGTPVTAPIREHANWTFTCQADPLLFVPWDDVPEALKDEVDANGPIPCEGSGTPGPWCMDCRFGNGEEGVWL